MLWQWKFVLLSIGAATAVCVANWQLDTQFTHLPSLPLAVVGAALGIFVSFRTNSCYQRWWEGRQLWGRLINTSRHIAIQSLRYLDDEHESTRTKIVRRHIAYVHTLRCLLREDSPHEDELVVQYLGAEELAEYQGSSNMTARILDEQMQEYIELNRLGAIDSFRLQEFDKSIRHLFDIQGGCERIKKTPLPKVYGFIVELMIQWFTILFPWALVGSLGWLTIPVSFLVGFSFKLISETGRILEDPFTHFWNALPLMALSRTIEVNLLELSGETDLPEIPKPVNGVLM